MRTHTLLLRGVNVGGKNRVPMAELRALLTQLGAEEVETYIQSGNAVCRLSPEGAATIARDLSDGLRARLGVASPVVVREAAEIATALASCPFEVPESERYIVFLADTPAPERVSALDPNRSPGHRFQVRGADIYLHLPTGVATTKLSNDWFDRQLGTVSTVRNWRTLLALHALLTASPTTPLAQRSSASMSTR